MRKRKFIAINKRDPKIKKILRLASIVTKRRKVNTMGVRSKSSSLTFLVTAMIAQKLSVLSFQPNFLRNIINKPSVSNYYH